MGYQSTGNTKSNLTKSLLPEAPHAVTPIGIPPAPTSEKAMAPPLQYSCLANLMDGGAW